MPYRLREQMLDIHYFDLLDELLIKWCDSHLNKSCAKCKDRDMTSALCDLCSNWRLKHGKEVNRNGSEQR